MLNKSGDVAPEAAEKTFLRDKLVVDGYVILEGLLPLQKVEQMREQFLRLLAAEVAKGQSNRGANRYQMYVPFSPPFNDPELYENEDALQILRPLLGDDLALCYLASDTPLPGAEYQKVHSDTRLLFPESGLSLPPYGIVMNVPLVDFTEENGPLELWPGGTHYMPRAVDIQRLAPSMQSKRLLPRAGDVVLRDLRAWHRGTPNHSTEARPNLALVYTRGWYRFEQRPLVLSEGVYASLPETTQRLLRYSIIEK